MTRQWAVECCQRFFSIDADTRAALTRHNGGDAIKSLWRDSPETFYESPLQILRQEIFHATFDGKCYQHPGFWLAIHASDIVLDVGCGTSEVARAPWIARGNQYHGVEPSNACRDYTDDKFQETWWYSTSPTLAHAPRNVGGLVCLDVLEHVPDPLAFQQSMWDHLDVGGHALLRFDSVYPHPGHLLESIEQLPAWWSWLKAHANIIEVETYVWAQKTC
jgi:hypothetical protein